MHELDIAKKIADIVIETAKREGMEKINNLQVKIGRMAAVNIENMEYLIRQQHKMLSNITLEVEQIDVAVTCRKCESKIIDKRFAEHDFAHTYAHAPQMYMPEACPKCGGTDMDLISGQELELVAME